MSIFNRSFATVFACAIVTLVVADGATGQTAPATAAPQASREEILAAQTKDDTGGSAEAGRPLFDQRCAACHRFGGIGKDVGPDLTTITSRFKKKDVLESILWPSRVISDQYQAEMFEMKDGKVVSGVIIRETAAAVLIRTAESPDKPVAVAKAEIANRAASTVSLMPEGLFDGLSHKQIADLVTFVMTPPPDK
jgi:putative heme-binding domain-containing protein